MTDGTGGAAAGLASLLASAPFGSGVLPAAAAAAPYTPAVAALQPAASSGMAPFGFSGVKPHTLTPTPSSAALVPAPSPPALRLPSGADEHQTAAQSTHGSAAPRPPAASHSCGIVYSLPAAAAFGTLHGRTHTHTAPLSPAVFATSAGHCPNAACGAENKLAARFCHECGLLLAMPVAAEADRRWPSVPAAPPQPSLVAPLPRSAEPKPAESAAAAAGLYSVCTAAFAHAADGWPRTLSAPATMLLCMRCGFRGKPR
jgi:hypothetical protein